MTNPMLAHAVMRYDKSLVGTEVEETEEGYIKGRAIVTRCGVFIYKNADGTTRAELRHPDDVTEQESLESIKMIPIVDGHPTEKLVDATNSKKLSVGYTGELVENEYPYIISNLVVTDKEAVEKIKSKKRNQLSLGYTVDLLPETGVYDGMQYDFRQKNIRYNHLALVDEGRAGPQARIALDGLDAENLEINEIGVNQMVKKQRKIKIDECEYMVDDAVASKMDEVYAEKAKLEARLAEIQEMLDKTSAEKDSLLEAKEKPELDEIGPDGKEEPAPDMEPPIKMENHPVEEPKSTKMDSVDIKKLVKERVKLETLANKYLDRATKARMDSMSDLEVKKKIILNFQPKAQLDEKSETYINARFDSVLEAIPQESVLAAPARNDGRKDYMSADEARQAMIKRQKEGSKQTNLRGH